MQIGGSKIQPIEGLKINENPKYLDQYGQAHLDAVASIEEQKQKEISTDTNIGNKQDQNKFMSRQEFDGIHGKMTADGYSDKEIIDGILDKGYELEGWRETQENLHIETQQEEEKKGFMSLTDMAQNKSEWSKKLGTELLDIGKERFGNIKDIVTGQDPQMQSLWKGIQQSDLPTGLKLAEYFKAINRGGLWVVGEAGGGVSEAIFSGIKSLIPEEKQANIKQGLKTIGNTKLGQAGLEALTEGMDMYEGWLNKSERNKRIGKDIEAIINIADFVPIGAGANILGKGIKKVGGVGAKVLKEGAGLVGEGVESLAKQVDFDGAIKQVIKDVSPSIKNIKNKVNVKNKVKQLNKKPGNVIKMISEPETAKTYKQALKEGRLLAPERNNILKKLIGNKKIEILPTKQIEESMKIINDNIPVPSKDPGKFYKQMDDIIVDTAVSLKPRLQTIGLDDVSKKTINEATKDISQNLFNNKTIANTLSTTDKKKMKEILTILNESSNAEELRQSRILYDKITPSSVKKATNLSSDALQIKQDTRLKNRRTINNVIDDIVKQSDNVGVKKDFRKMSSLYEAQNNLVLNIPNLAKATSGLFSKKNLARGLLGAVGLGSLSQL